MNQPITFQTILSASKDQVSSEIGGEAVILNLQSGTYYGLDEVGNRIWELIQTPRSVKEVQETILEEYEVETDQCEKDLIALLQLLADENLIEIERKNATTL